jgi:hypothetical protein
MPKTIIHRNSQNVFPYLAITPNAKSDNNAKHPFLKRQKLQIPRDLSTMEYILYRICHTLRIYPPAVRHCIAQSAKAWEPQDNNSTQKREVKSISTFISAALIEVKQRSFWERSLLDKAHNFQNCIRQRLNNTTSTLSEQSSWSSNIRQIQVSPFAFRSRLHQSGLFLTCLLLLYPLIKSIESKHDSTFTKSSYERPHRH